MISPLPQADQSVSFSCPCHVSVAALFSPLPSVLALLQQLPLPTNNTCTGNHSVNIECLNSTSFKCLNSTDNTF